MVLERPREDIYVEVMDAFCGNYAHVRGLTLSGRVAAAALCATAAAAAAGGARWQLRSPPVSDEPLETGWLTKQGLVKKNWKRRFFVAGNEASNFAVRRARRRGRGRCGRVSQVCCLFACLFVCPASVIGARRVV